MAAKSTRICEMCKEATTVAMDERYCKACKKVVLAQLKNDGYLGPAPWIGYTNRGVDHRENTLETKRGRD